jgi:hypothetical protein
MRFMAVSVSQRPSRSRVRALSRVGTGDITVAPSGAGLHEVDVKVA